MLFIATRFVDGPDLAQIVLRDGPLDPGGRDGWSGRLPPRSTPRTLAAWCTAT